MDDYELKKRSIIIAGHATSVTLETIFWQAFRHIAKEQGLSVGDLATQIDEERHSNLSSAIRVYVLKYYQDLKA